MSHGRTRLGRLGVPGVGLEGVELAEVLLLEVAVDLLLVNDSQGEGLFGDLENKISRQLHRHRH